MSNQSCCAFVVVAEVVWFLKRQVVSQSLCYGARNGYSAMIYSGLQCTVRSSARTNDDPLRRPTFRASALS